LQKLKYVLVENWWLNAKSLVNFNSIIKSISFLTGKALLNNVLFLVTSNNICYLVGFEGYHNLIHNVMHYLKSILYISIHIILSVPCSNLTNPDNGVITCSLGDDGVPSYEDTCSFTCNTGYVLTGSDTRTCQSNRSWSGSDTMCSRGE